MKAAPEISVVMSVFNGADGLAATMDSVLRQQGCDFECIVVDDGSTDGSADMLDSYAAGDPRVKVIHQANTGLTRALIRGCDAAIGAFIARQDADDVSLPGRLREQAAFLRAHPDVIAVASAIRFLAPGGEWLYDAVPADTVDVALDAKRFGAPPLVATAFRRDAYRRVGGFRAAFRVAQDLDLWLRLVELGPCRGLPAVHYEATMTQDGITSRRRGEQERFRALAVACARRRRAGLGDEGLLATAVPDSSPPVRTPARYRAAFNYFIASVLRQRDPPAARRYLRLALRDNPLHLKALVRLVLG